LVGRLLIGNGANAAASGGAGAAGAGLLTDAFDRALRDGPAPAEVFVEASSTSVAECCCHEAFCALCASSVTGPSSLVVLDEVFCGFGRAGRMFGF
jgi:adenosylmethionine-8-amino-7-oxononanoate aminotransferase